MKPAWAGDFPRLYELYLDSDRVSRNNYFANFESHLIGRDAREKYRLIEEDLQKLDENIWRELKQKAYKYVASKHRDRAFEQLFNILNEVKGYLYLKTEGCNEIHFMPEKDVKTPDLYGQCGSTRILMEVKTINRSDNERDWMQANSELRNGHMTTRQVQTILSDLLVEKISRTINEAKTQLVNGASNEIQRRIVYLIIKPDICTALNSSNLVELEAFIKEQSDDKVEVKYYFNGW